MDKARKLTDKELANMEKRVNEIYSEAYDDISESWNKFMESHAPKLEKAQKELEEAKKSGDKEAIAKARDEYDRIARNITINDQRYEAMVDETAAKLAHTNEVALAYVNDQMPKIYTTNYNAFGDNEIDGYSFALVNENAVKNLAKTDKTLLPKKKVDVPKDMRWNEKNINSQMIQGILQGESIPKIATRLMNVTNMNQASAIRNARTMTTSAENKGRQDSFKKAESDGVIMKRRWVATHDDRTRAAHEELDGVEVDLDEAWENEYGQIMYPGDPSADPCNVYNCRCSIRSVVIGFKWNEELEEEAEEVESKTIYEPNLTNVVDFEGKDNVSKALENLDADEAQIWNNYIDDVNYKLITSEESETAFHYAGTKDVNIFDYSNETTFFHETAHAMDDDSIIGDVTITSSRKAIGSDDWIDSKPYTYEISSASRASQEIYDLNEHAWNDDNKAFMAWSNMKDEDDLQSLIHSVREFRDKYGEDASGILGDLIDAHTLGKYPMSVFAGGHGESYWKRDGSLASKEAWAEISSLKALGKQDVIDELAKILPNRVESTETIYNIVFKGADAYEHKISDKTDTRVSEQIWRFRRKP